MLFNLKLIVFGIWLDILIVKGSEIETINNLTSYLFQSYSALQKPSYDLEIGIDVQFNQLISIDEKNQIMTSSFYLGVEWLDERLKWDLKQFNIGEILVPVNKLWLPDLYIINTADTDGFIPISSKYFGLVEHDGNVTLTINLCLLKTRCPINIAGFPFDNQTCNIQIGSWSYDYQQLSLSGKDTSFETKDYIDNAVWNITKVAIEEKDTSKRLSNSTDLILKIYIKRRPTNYMLNNLYPCFVLNVVTLLSFWVPFAAAFAASKFNCVLNIYFELKPIELINIKRHVHVFDPSRV